MSRKILFAFVKDCFPITEDDKHWGIAGNASQSSNEAAAKHLKETSYICGY